MKIRVITVCLTLLCIFSSDYGTASSTSLSANTNQEVGSSQFWNFFRDSSSKDNYRLSSAQILSSVIIYIRENYVEPERMIPMDMFLKAMENIEKEIPEVLIDTTQAPQLIKVEVGQQDRKFNVEGLDALWEITLHIRDIFRFIEENIKFTNEELKNVEYAAINGMLSTLDPHSVFLSPKNYKEVRLSTRGEFGGLGIVISIRDGSLTVISPISGTPASRAGIKAKDKITRIGEESTINMALDEAVQRLRGKPGTKISIWVLRKGWTVPRKFVLTRSIIKIKSVTSHLLDDSIGYIKLKSFQKNSYDDLVAHLSQLRNQNQGQELKGLVLDLRNNPGGLLDQAIIVADYFLDKGPIVITEGGDQRKVQFAEDQGNEPKFPVAVLVNSGSASASEIVSGALKNHDRGIVLGQQTFGKGTVQVLYDFHDRSALKLTVAEYLTPGDISIQGVGITPDIFLNPVVVKKDRLHLLRTNGMLRESHLEHSIDSQQTQKAKEQKPLITIDYLYDEDLDTPENEDDFTNDFEIELTQKLLKSFHSENRIALLEQSKKFFNDSQQEEIQKISAALKPLNVDWQACDSSHPVDTTKIQISFEAKSLDQKGKQTSQLIAGGKVRFMAKVKNLTSSPLCRLYASTKSDSSLFDRREFAFGYVKPGQEKQWHVDVDIPEDTYAWSERVDLNFQEQHNSIPVSKHVQLKIEELPSPQFAFTYQLVETQGNGDGILQDREKVNVVLHIKNIGQGKALQTMATLKNVTGKELYLSSGRAKLGELKPGQQSTAILSFELRGPLDENAKLKLNVFDSKLGEFISEEITWPVAKTSIMVKPLVGIVTQLHNQSFGIYSGASLTSPKLVSWDKRSPVEVIAKAGNWYKVRLPGKNPIVGFVQQDHASFKSSKQKARAARKKNIAFNILYPWTSPSIKIPKEAIGSFVEKENLRLEGTILNDGRMKDMYIFVNNQKVYFKPLEKADASKPAPEKIRNKFLDEPQMIYPFESILPLKEGPNTISIIARESDNLIRRRTFGIFRKRISSQQD